MNNPGKDFKSEFGEYLRKLDTNTVAVAVAIFIGILTLILVLLVRRRRIQRRRVLILGLCDAGKTVLFAQLVHRQSADTFTSIKENVGPYYPKNKKSALSIVDIPGHERVRIATFDQFKATARAIIYMVDSNTLLKEIRDVAEFLYTVLCDNVIANNCPPLVIACNKQDLGFSKSMKVIQSQLEKEINTLRVTKSAQLFSTSETGNNNTFLGKRDKDFQFSHLTPIKISFVECTAAGEDVQVASIQDWLETVA